MILYADTSVIVPLIIDERTSERCRQLWADARSLATTRSTFVETAAALASAFRAGRVDDDEVQIAHRNLDRLWAQMNVVELDAELMHAAAACARRYRLRGYDAVQCASALSVAGIDLVAATGDLAIQRAWREAGLAVAVL